MGCHRTPWSNVQSRNWQWCTVRFGVRREGTCLNNYAPTVPRKLSAVVACYCDTPAIPIMHVRLGAVFRKLGVDYEIVFVNDGSPDNAAEILAALAKQDNRVIVINHTRNFGSQAAFTSGIRI